MKISKHLHSCLLIEENNKTVLIDPGVFTYQEKALDVTKISKLDYLLITHEHTDHCYPPFIKEILAKFPEAKIITNPSVEKMLAEESISVHTDLSNLSSDAGIQFEEVPHERIFDLDAPQNVMFEIFGKLAHPGDSISFKTNKEILALPLLGASWMITQAAEKAVELKPKIIIPIHDYSWKDSIRREYYKRLKEFFNEKGIEFKSLETGEVIEI